MPFGSRENNFWFVVAVIFVSVSVLTSMVGQVMWNTREIRRSIVQHVELQKEHAAIVETLGRIEASVGRPGGSR